jgi:hypothetical protein
VLHAECRIGSMLKTHWPWWVFAGLVLVFLTLSYIAPADGTRQKLAGVFLLTFISVGAIVRRLPPVRHVDPTASRGLSIVPLAT